MDVYHIWVSNERFLEISGNRRGFERIDRRNIEAAIIPEKRGAARQKATF